MAHAPAFPSTSAPDFSKRLDDIGWALFFILTGVIWLLPADRLPPGTWLIASGLLLLGLNAVRSIAKVPISWFTVTIGVLALLAGVSALWALRLPLAAICLVFFGLWLLVRQLRG